MLYTTTTKEVAKKIHMKFILFGLLLAIVRGTGIRQKKVLENALLQSLTTNSTNVTMKVSQENISDRSSRFLDIIGLQGRKKDGTNFAMDTANKIRAYRRQKTLSQRTVRFPLVDFATCCALEVKKLEFLRICTTQLSQLSLTPITCTEAVEGSGVVITFKAPEATLASLLDPRIANSTVPNITNSYEELFDLGLSEPYIVSAQEVPHFFGFDGSSYDFKGEPDQVFNIISDLDFQLNALFVSSPVEGQTFMGELGIMTGGHKLRITPSTLIIDGEERDNGSYRPSIELQVTREAGGEETMVRSRSFTVKMTLMIIKSQHHHPFLYLDTDYSVAAKFMSRPHGLLGQTARYLLSGGPLPHTLTVSPKNKNSKGFLEGSKTDYLVMDGIFGTNFVYNQYNEASGI